jgi:hypothetical protein
MRGTRIGQTGLRSGPQNHFMSIHPFYPEESHTVSWHAMLDSAETEADVVRITREFLATLSPYDIARLPPHCRPGKMVDMSDISGYAFVIVRHRCVPGAGTARVAHKLASFFTSASTRLARICSTHQPVARSSTPGPIGRTA